MEKGIINMINRKIIDFGENLQIWVYIQYTKSTYNFLKSANMDKIIKWNEWKK